jgi:hypothetical protein
MKRPPSWLIISLVAGVPFITVGVAAIYYLFLPVTFSGRVISRSTGAPVAEALVAVESDQAFSLTDMTAFGSYVKTDKDGKFEAEAKGSWVSVRVWKPGYAMAGVLYGPALARRWRDNVVAMREMSQTNWVQEHDGFYPFAPGSGFSFAQGRVVQGDGPAADIVITEDRDVRTAAYIEAQGGGGVIFQPFIGGIDFYNSPEAPAAGYEKRVKVNTSEMGLYYLRTRDGSRYAKFRFMTPIAMPPEGPEYLALEETRLIWAYQPDGTRHLEVVAGRGMPFPFHKFGL